MEPMENSVQDQTPIQSYPTMPSSKKGGIKKVWIIIALAVVAIYAFLFLRPTDTEPVKPEPTVSPTAVVAEPTVTPAEQLTTTPEPTEAVKKESTGPSIQVQNGSGTEGVAVKMKTALEDEGYDSVETGNADNFDYVGATIKAKDTSVATAMKIKTQLTDYTFADKIESLASDSEFDIVIIVGK